jgi:hypothetical protein
MNWQQRSHIDSWQTCRLSSPQQFVPSAWHVSMPGEGHASGGWLIVKLV